MSLLPPLLASLAASLVIKKYPFFMENCRYIASGSGDYSAAIHQEEGLKAVYQ
jgi:hypothetical protein